MRKPTIKTFIRRLERHKADLAKTRDSLRDLEAEISELAYNAERAVDDISCAIDALSELV